MARMKKTLLTQIKPGPFCGGRAVVEGSEGGKELNTARIYCTVCGCGTKTFKKADAIQNEDALQSAVAVWNMRNGYGMRGTNNE